MKVVALDSAELLRLNHSEKINTLHALFCCLVHSRGHGLFLAFKKL